MKPISLTFEKSMKYIFIYFRLYRDRRYVTCAHNTGLVLDINIRLRVGLLLIINDIRTVYC